jgi:hypothetical protein
MNISVGTFIAIACQGEVGTGVENTVAPSLSAADYNVGTTVTVSLGTWTGATALAGSLRYVSDDTEIDTFTADGTYDLADADFGESLYLYVVPNGDTGAAVASAAVGPVAEVPVQVLGAELLTNPLFSNWTTDNPDGWTVTGESGSDPMVTQVASGGGAGTGAARFYSSATNSQPRLAQSILTLGDYYETELDMSAYVSGPLIAIRHGGASADLDTLTSVHVTRGLRRATGTTNLTLIPDGNAPVDFTVNAVSVKKVTPNAQLTAPSATMRLDFYYDLAASPLQGNEVRLFARISDFAAGNYWELRLIRVSGQWNVELNRVATFTRTLIASASNIGTTDGLRLNFNGNDISLFTTANAGGLWTQRDTTKTNATYNTATGVNVMYTSDITPGQLRYAPADV